MQKNGWIAVKRETQCKAKTKGCALEAEKSGVSWWALRICTRFQRKHTVWMRCSNSDAHTAFGIVRNTCWNFHECDRPTLLGPLKKPMVLKRWNAKTTIIALCIDASRQFSYWNNWKVNASNQRQGERERQRCVKWGEPLQCNVETKPKTELCVFQ